MNGIGGMSPLHPAQCGLLCLGVSVDGWQIVTKVLPFQRKRTEKECKKMTIPSFSADESLYTSARHYLGRGLIPTLSGEIYPALAFHCRGGYCDCEGVADCVKMSRSGWCGNWIRCTSRGG